MKFKNCSFKATLIIWILLIYSFHHYINFYACSYFLYLVIRHYYNLHSLLRGCFLLFNELCSSCVRFQGFCAQTYWRPQTHPQHFFDRFVIPYCLDRCLYLIDLFFFCIRLYSSWNQSFHLTWCKDGSSLDYLFLCLFSVLWYSRFQSRNYQLSSIKEYSR